MNSTQTASNESTSPCQREVSVEVPAEVVNQEEQAVVSRLQKFARVPGFRKGKVPATVIRQRFQEDIKSEMIEHLVPRYFREETEKQKLVPISQPRVTELELKAGSPMTFRATFEILPEFGVDGYKEVRADRNEVAVTDEEVDQTVNALREQQATYDNVDEERPLAAGDHAQASFNGTSTEEGAQPINVDDVLVEIGGADTIKEFTENLTGAKVGEQRGFEVSYPEDFSDKRLAGKTVRYEVTVKGIKRKSTPELNDEFAKQLGAEFETLDKLKEKIRENMLHEKTHQEEHRGKEKLVQDLVTKFDIPVPEALIEQQIDTRLERGLRALAAQGMRTEDLKRLDVTRLREGQREAAKREVQESLLLDKIADEEKLEVSEEELDKEIESMARQMQQPADAVRKRLEEARSLDRVRARLRNEKTLETLYRRTE